MWTKFGQVAGKAKSYISKNKKSLGQKVGLAAAVVIPTGIYIASDGPRKHQNVRIEMQKIAKERRAGKKFTRKEIKARLDKAKKSKREFTFLG